jgi:hypothetical protein
MLHLQSEFRLASEHNITEEVDQLNSQIAKCETQISTQLNDLSTWLNLEAIESLTLVRKVNKNSVKNLILNDFKNINSLQAKLEDLIFKFNTGHSEFFIFKPFRKKYLIGF